MNVVLDFEHILSQTQILSLTYLGIINGFFDVIRNDTITPEKLATATVCDAGYVVRWLDAAMSAQLVKVEAEGYLKIGSCLEGVGALSNDVNKAKVLQAIYSVLICDAMSPHFRTGERPGYEIVNLFPTLRPWYGYIFESLYGPIWEREVLPNLPCIAQVDSFGGICVDYSCGNGWLLRRIASITQRLNCIGVTDADTTGFQPLERTRYVKTAEFLNGTENIDIIVLNKVIHHFGNELKSTMELLAQKLSSGGTFVIWDFNWPIYPDSRADNDDRCFLNLIEHVQQSEFIARNVLVENLRLMDFSVKEFPIRGGRDVLLVGRKK